MRHTPRRLSDDRVRLAGVVGGLLIVALAISVLFTVSRYDTALRSAKTVSERRANALVAQDAVTAFWTQREAMNEWFLLRTPKLTNEVREKTAAFDDAVGRLAASSTAEQAQIRQASAGNALFRQTFDSLQRSAGTVVASENKALDALNAREDGVVGPLGSLERSSASAVALAQRASRRSAGDAHDAAIVTAALGLLLALFIASMLIVIRRLLSSMRATAEVLGTSVDGVTRIARAA